MPAVSVDLTVEVRGLSRLTRQFGWMGRRIRQRAHLLCERHARLAEQFIVQVKLRRPGPSVRRGGRPGPSPGGRDEPVLHRDHGALAQSIQVEPAREVGNDEIVAEVGLRSGLVYGLIHEVGGTIVPKRAKALRFYYAPAGRWVITQRVQMPPRPFVQPAARRQRPEFEREASALPGEVAREAEGRQ
jgi:hypothetical protein